MPLVEHELVVALVVPCVFGSGQVVHFASDVRITCPFEGAEMADENDRRTIEAPTTIDLPDGPGEIVLHVPVALFGRHERVLAEAPAHVVREGDVIVNVAPPDVTVWNTLEQPPRKVDFERKNGQLVSAKVTDL